LPPKNVFKHKKAREKILLGQKKNLLGKKWLTIKPFCYGKPHAFEELTSQKIDAWKVDGKKEWLKGGRAG
jgi:hypothetical protein